MMALGLFNTVLWVVVVSQLKHEGPYVPWHVLCSGVFTAVCAFRSMLPRIDLERYCLLDSMASSMVIGRTGATLAEISFACQIALLLHEAGNLAELHWVQMLAYPVVFLLSLAQVFCWSSVISLNHLGHTMKSLYGHHLCPCGPPWLFVVSRRPVANGLFHRCRFLWAMWRSWLVDVPCITDVGVKAKQKTKRLGFQEGFATL